MSAVTLTVPSIQAQRRAQVAQARAESRARLRERTEAIVLFVITAGVLTTLGVRTTTQLHLVYPDALTRLDHAFISWWNTPARFRSIGFMYPPLQTVALLPVALLRPLATSLVGLPLFAGICAGAVVASLGRTLALFEVSWWMRWPLLALFVLNPVFLDYGSNGGATCLVMALLALGLHSFCVWYVRGGDHVRSLGACGFWLSIAFLARYETILWLALIALIVACVRAARGARMMEVVALEAILLAPVVYVFCIWSAISALVGGGGLLSWITRAGAEHIAGVTYGGRHSFLSRAGGVIDTLWRISPLLLIVPAVLVVLSLVLRRPILLGVAALVLVGAGVGVLRMALYPNPTLLQPAYAMIALVPMVIALAWCISRIPRRRSFGPLTGRLIAVILALVGMAAALPSAYSLLDHDHNVYDQAFHTALASHLQRITPAHGRPGVASPASIYADAQGLATFMQAAGPAPRSVLLDDLAFPGLVVTTNTAEPYQTRAELGDTAWRRLLDQPVKRGHLQYLVVGNPKLTVPGYPHDLIAAHYPNAYSGAMPHTAVIYRNPLVAVVELNPPPLFPSFKVLPSSQAQLLSLYQRLPSLSPTTKRAKAF